MDEYKILIVEDDSGTRLALCDFLKQNGFKNVVSASDGSSGLCRARDYNPHLIISDISMPVMDGYAFIQELRGHNVLKAIPVIILTGRAEMVDLFRMAEIYNYLIKPVEPQALLDMVNRVLGIGGSAEDYGSETVLGKIEKIEEMMAREKEKKTPAVRMLWENIRRILRKSDSD